MTKKAVLFDLDGTLLNSLPDISRCMNTVLRQMALPEYPMPNYRYMTGNGALKLCERAAGENHQEKVPEILTKYSELYAGHCFDESYLYEGVADMLSALKAAGLRLVVLSNKDDPDVATVIGHYFPVSPFEITRGRREGVPIKPDPTAALQIAAEMGLKPDEFWYLGDTPTDLACCRGAGMDFIAVGWGFRSWEELHAAGATRIVAQPGEALSIMLG